MSESWRLRCTEHDVPAEDGVNRGQGFLRAVAALREPYLALLAADGSEEIEITTWAYGSRTGLYFLQEHPTCTLELISEYGDTEPIDKRCDVKALHVAGAQCERQAGHGGWHRATLERFRGRLEWQP